MGLSISVGQLAFLSRDSEDVESAECERESLKKLNKVLAKNRLPEHVEPETLPPLTNRANLQGYPYSFLHYLRRFAAHAARKPRWKPKPFPDDADPAEDPLVIDELTMLSSHLLCHSDCEGYYVPIDFAEPLFASEKLVPGGMLGSSHGLMRELIAVAKPLGIKLTSGRLADTEADRVNGLAQSGEPFWIEYAVWLSLFEVSRLSIEHETAICFG